MRKAIHYTWDHVKRGRRAALTHHSTAHVELPQIPVKAQRLIVILLHFNEPGLDMHLRRRHVQHLNGFLYGVQILRCRADEQHTQPVVKENAFGGSRFRPSVVKKLLAATLKFTVELVVVTNDNPPPLPPPPPPRRRRHRHRHRTVERKLRFREPG